MIKDLDGYKPENVEYVISDNAKEILPMSLDFTQVKGMKTKTPVEVIKYVGKNFVSTFPTNETTERLLDDYEIHNIREEYCVTQENDVPARKAELDETLERIKVEKKAAEEAYNAVLQDVARLAAEVKHGTKETVLSNNTTFSIAIAGYHAIYTYDKSSGCFVLAKATPIYDKRSFWANENENREKLKELFNIELPEVEAPVETSDANEESNSSPDDLPFGDDDEEEND